MQWRCSRQTWRLQRADAPTRTCALKRGGEQGPCAGPPGRVAMCPEPLREELSSGLLRQAVCQLALRRNPSRNCCTFCQPLLVDKNLDRSSCLSAESSLELVLVKKVKECLRIRNKGRRMLELCGGRTVEMQVRIAAGPKEHTEVK